MQQTGVHADGKTRWGVVAMALTAGLIAAGHVGILPPALPAIRADLGLDLVTAGYLASLFGATGMLIAVFLGILADRANHRRLAIAGLALMALSGLAGSFARNGSDLLVSRFLEGIGFLAVVVAAPSLIAEAASGRDRQMALGLWPGYMPGGVSLTILLAPLLLTAEGWRGLWIALAVLTAAFAAFMLCAGEMTSRQRAGAQHEAAWRSVRAALGQAGPWLVAGCFALYGAQLYAIITWMPTFVIEERELSAPTAASLTALVVVTNGLCNIVGGWLLHRGVAPWAMIFTAGFAMAISAIAAFSPLPDLVRYVAAIALCGAGGVVASASFAAAPLFARAPEERGTINGLLVQASNLAQFAGPTAAAAGASRSGRWESALWLMVGANVVMIALALLMHRHEKLLAA
jgi:MFS family permease